MKFRFIRTQDPEYATELMLRWENLRKPLGLPPGSEVLPEDKDSLHFTAYDKKQMVGCVVFHPENKEKGRLYQMAVSQEYRGKGFGRKMIATLEQFLSKSGYKEVYLYARDESIGFYKRVGYHLDGESTQLAGISHFLMSKTIV